MRDLHDAHSDKLSLRAAWAIFAVGSLAILYLTLKPLDFRFQALTLSQYLSRFVLPPSSPLDFPNNIFLFMPFGFGLAALLDRCQGSPRRLWPIVGVCGFLLTWLVESLQLFLTGRVSSVSDLLSNTLGALAGLGAYRLWQARLPIALRIRHLLGAPRQTAAILILYMAALAVLSLFLASSTRFTSWHPDYPLLIGNERGGQRPWRGHVHNLAFFDQALSEQEAQALLHSGDLTAVNGAGLLAFYPLSGTDPLEDKTGQQPPLEWQPPDGAPYELNGSHWLESDAPVTGLNRSLRDSSQLTVLLNVASASVEQGGPARIVSVSTNPLQRNLTIGQRKGDLVLRLNMPVSSDNGDALEMHFPGHFRDSSPAALLLTFDGLTASLYSSAAQTQAIEVLPGPAFYRYLNPYAAAHWRISSDPFLTWLYRLMFYAPLFLPIGMLLAGPWVKEWRRQDRISMIAFAVIIVPLVVEWALVFQSGQPLRPLHILLATGAVLLGDVAAGPLSALWHRASTTAA